MSNIVISLPLDIEDLCDTLKIVFVGADIPNRVELRKICGVSKRKVYNALVWLKNHNSMYRMIPINEINIAKLPEDDVPESIWTTIERIENTADGDVERTGYAGDPLVDAVTQGEAHTTNIFPITTGAILDVNGTTIASKDIGVHLLHKIKNGSSKALIDPSDTSTGNMENEDVYVIPRSNMPVNDCANPEFLLGLFPTLFPYVCGAPYDSTRPSPASLNQHIRYLLAYEDQRFEKHHSFMFVLFNIMQRRQACWNASLMASRPYFQDTATDLQTLTSKEIEAALISATSQTFSLITNPRVNMLMKRIRMVGGNVMGSAYSRASLRNQIHALIFNQGLPSIFMTINPADIHSRVALYFAGVDLDLDTILPEKIPSTYERAQIIASHPCMVEKGVLGPIKVYFGTVENQGRGSLHLHVLMWLDHDLTPSQLKESVKNEEFRNGLLGYLEDIIKQDLSKFDFDTSETDVPERQHTDLISNNECAISTTEINTTKLIPSIMPTPKPSMPNFALHFKNDIVQLVNSNNIHKHTITCYKYSKKDENPTCRMRMPRRIENVSSINIESDEIKLKRLHETINNFNEYIISACRSNMDIKYIFSGSDAKALVYYITDYVTKSNLSFHDTFSLVLKAIQSLEKQKLNIDAAVNAEEKSRRLVLRCYNTLASQQELSGVQVGSYLMGWPDHHTTHEFVNLFLIGIENYLQATLIEAQLKQQRQIENLCDVDQTWEQAFTIRHASITSESCKIIDHIQLLQECKNDRDEHLQQVIEAAQSEVVNDNLYPRRNDSDSDDENTGILDVLETIDMSDIPVLKEPGTKSEQIYFEKVVQAVDQANRFSNIQVSCMGSTKTLIYTRTRNKQICFDRKHLIPVTTELIQLNNRWQRQIKDEKERGRNTCMMERTESTFNEQNDADVNELVGAIEENVSLNFDSNNGLLNHRCIVPVSRITLLNEKTRDHIAQQFTLNKNQNAAFMIITGHLDGLDILNEDEKREQLIMCVPGCGGTGKSQLIRALTAYFTQANRAHKLRKLAPTSVAAAEIEGMTIHSFLGYGRNRKSKSKVINRPGQMTHENAWRFVEYVILDEMSMVGISFLA
ncbi:unnamed protein product [Rotaria magnacalcarata]|uniref:ATP-dependent DNA helicase n=1 Tax=Rotaria magnacalcarata TaxID=392030 RepID=A0A819UIZ5_9BILA|nr:unnamed protein product [Rotaria magnacalcarata]